MDREKLIREHAHAIWEAEGQPHGRHDQHWKQASRDLESADASPEAAVAMDEPVTGGDEALPAVSGMPVADEAQPAETAAPRPPASKPARAKAAAAPKKPRKTKA